MADLALSQSGLFYEGLPSEIWGVLHLPLGLFDFIPGTLEYLRGWEGDEREYLPMAYALLETFKHLLFALNSAALAAFLWNKYHKPPAAERDPLLPAQALLRRWIESGEAAFPLKDPLKLPKAWNEVHRAAVSGLFSMLDGHPRDWRTIAKALAAYFPYLDRARQHADEVSALGEALIALEMQSSGEPDPKILKMGQALLEQSLRMDSKQARSWRAPIRWGLLEGEALDAHIALGLKALPEDPYLNAWSLARNALVKGGEACESAAVVLKKKYGYFIESRRLQAELLAAAGKREASIEAYKSVLVGRPLDRALTRWARAFATAAYGDEAANLSPLDESTRRPEPSEWADGALWAPERPTPPRTSLRLLGFACVALSFSALPLEKVRANHQFAEFSGIWKCVGLGLESGDWVSEEAFPAMLVSKDEKLIKDFEEQSCWVHSGGVDVMGGHIARWYTGKYHDYRCDADREGWSLDAWGDSTAAKARARLKDGRLWASYGDYAFRMVFQRPGLWYPPHSLNELRACGSDCEQSGATTSCPKEKFASQPSPTPRPTMDWSGYGGYDDYD